MTQQTDRELIQHLVNELQGYRVAHPDHEMPALEAGRTRLAQPEPEIEPAAYLHRQGNYTEASERSLSEDEKARGWTEEPLFHHPLAQLEPEGPTGNQAITRALIAVSGGLCYFTADAKHAQLLTVQKILLEALRPEPEGPTDEELYQFWESHPELGLTCDEPVKLLRAGLTRFARPTIKPVPVAERLPGPGAEVG